MSRFVLTAQVQLQAPNNVRQVVNQIQNQLAGVNIPVNVQNAASATRQINQIRAATNDATTAAERMGAAFGVSLKRFASFSIATRAVGLFTNGLAGAIRDAIEFERQLIKVAQVSNQSVASLKGLTSTITELATSLGVESKSLLEVSTILKQAGLSANDTAIALRTLAKAALAPNFDSITETTEGAIAVLAQFGLGVQALEGQLSSIDAVAGAFAVEASDLIDVIRRTGGVFKSSGGDLNELLALFTSVRATTRESAESIGTGLRTIFTRIQRPKTIEYLKQFGIELVDLEGRFVGPFEAVKRLSAALNGLGEGDLTFIRIAEELGGFRQIGKVLPLLQQFAVAQQALNVAQKAGDGLTTNAITAQQALAIRITKVKEEFLAFVRGVTESRGFQLFVNTALNLASAFIKIGEALTPVIPLLTAMMAINISRGIGSFLTSIPRGISSNRFSKGGAVLGFNSGGIVPGVGNKDSVPAMLTPGEVVINKSAVQKYGAGNLVRMNKYGYGGKVSDLASIYPTISKADNYQDYKNKRIKDNSKFIKVVPSIEERIDFREKYKGKSYEKFENFVANKYNLGNPAAGFQFLDYPNKRAEAKFLPFGSTYKDGDGRGNNEKTAAAKNFLFENSLLNLPGNRLNISAKTFGTSAIASKPITVYWGDPSDFFKSISRTSLAQERFPSGAYSIGGLVQRFEEGGVAQRRVGIIDSDVLRDKKNAARVAEGMKLLDAKSEADYAIKLSKLAGEARQSGALGRFSVMAGAAANRKSSVATGRGANDNATLRKTTRKQILHPDDLKDVDQVMSLTTTLKESKLDYMGMADRIYVKDSSTEDEQKLVKLFERQRNLQKDPTLYGRETGTTEGLNPDYGLQTASLISQFGTTEDRTNKGKVMTLGEKTDKEGNPRFQIRRKRFEELPELVSAKGQFPGAASPLTRGHAETAVGTLLAKVREKYPDATHKDLLFALAPDLSLSGGSQGREHGARYGEYPASFRRDLIKLALPEMMISSANSPSQTGINSRIAEIEKGATGRRRFAVMEKDAPVVISKAENENPEGVMERYRSAGLTPYNIARSSDVEGDSISGTATRQAVIDKDYAKLDLAVLPKVGSAIKANQPQLRNRRMMVPLVQRALDIFTQANTSKVNEQVDEILKNASGGPFTRMTPKFKEAHPNLVKQIKQLRTSRDIFERETFLDPAHELIRIISDRYPDIYGLDVTRQEPLDIPVTEDTVKQHIVDSSKLSSYFRPGLSFNGDAVQLSPTLQKVKDAVEKEVKSEPVTAPQEVKEIVAPTSRSEIFKVLSRDEAAIASGVDKLKVYDIMGLRRELTPAEQKVQEAVREAYVNKIKRKGAASKAQTTKLRTKGLEFGAAGLFGKAFAAQNIKIESDKLSSSRMVRVISGVMDQATATRLSTTMSQGVSDIISQGTSIVQSGSKATTTPSIQGLNVNTNATIQGGLIEQIIQQLGGPGAVKGKGFDFPDGLKGAAKYFNIDPNVPTDVKRTLSGPSTIKDNIVTYLKNVMGYNNGGLVQNFEDGGKSIADLKNYRLNAREYRDKVNLDSLMKDDLPSKLYSGFKTTRRSIIEKGLAGEKGYDPNKLINKIFTMPSYLSTSSTEGGGKSFSDIKGGLMHINTSPQRKGIDVLSTIGSGSASKLYEREAEFILPKNSSFKINEVLKTDGPFGWRKEWGSPDFLEIGVNQLASGGLAEAVPEMTSLMQGLYGKKADKKPAKDYGKIALRSDGSTINATYFKNDQREGYVSAYKMRDYLYYVGLSKATQGYGPKLYDAVMEEATSKGAMLTSDRSSISGAAKKVWEYYFKNRGDVKKTPLKPDDWVRNQAEIDPKLYGKPETWPPPTDPAWILQSGYSKSPSLINDKNSVVRMGDSANSGAMALQYFSRANGGRLGFETGGTVPALVSNGEAYVPPKVAKRIGYGTLNRMNQADRNGMSRFSDGGISVFKGPGTGTSDSIPANLPVGSFIVRAKATKALGLNRGGRVRFADGGGVYGEKIGNLYDVRAMLKEQAKTATGNESLIIAQKLKEVEKEMDTLVNAYNRLAGTIDQSTKDEESSRNDLDKANDALLKRLETRLAIAGDDEEEKKRIIEKARSGGYRDKKGNDILRSENLAISKAENAVSDARSRKDVAKEKMEYRFGGQPAGFDAEARRRGVTPFPFPTPSGDTSASGGSSSPPSGGPSSSGDESEDSRQGFNKLTNVLSIASASLNGLIQTVDGSGSAFTNGISGILGSITTLSSSFSVLEELTGQQVNSVSDFLALNKTTGNSFVGIDEDGNKKEGGIADLIEKNLGSGFFGKLTTNLTVGVGNMVGAFSQGAAAFQLVSSALLSFNTTQAKLDSAIKSGNVELAGSLAIQNDTIKDITSAGGYIAGGIAVVAQGLASLATIFPALVPTFAAIAAPVAATIGPFIAIAAAIALATGAILALTGNFDIVTNAFTYLRDTIRNVASYLAGLVGIQVDTAEQANKKSKTKAELESSNAKIQNIAQAQQREQNLSLDLFSKGKIDTKEAFKPFNDEAKAVLDNQNISRERMQVLQETNVDGKNDAEINALKNESRKTFDDFEKKASPIIDQSFRNSAVSGKSFDDAFKQLPQGLQDFLKSNDEYMQTARKSYENLSKSVQDNIEKLKSLNFGLDPVISKAKATSLSIDLFNSRLQVGGASIADSVKIIEAGLTNAASNMDMGQFNSAVNQVGSVMASLGASEAQVKDFTGTLGELNNIQSSFGTYLNEIKKEYAAMGKVPTPDDLIKSFKDKISQSLDARGVSPEVKKRIMSSLKGLDSLSPELKEKVLKDFESGNLQGIIDMFGPELAEEMKKQMGAMVEPLIKANDALVKVINERVEAEKNLVSAQREAIDLSLEGMQLQAKYGGNAVTPEIRRQAALESANAGRRRLGLEDVRGSNPNALRAGLNQIRSRFAELEQKRVEKGTFGPQGAEDEAVRSGLKDAQKDQVKLIRDLISAEEEQLKITKEKNKLEKDSLESLLAGDIDKFFEQQAAVGATAAIAAGNQAAINQFGGQALGGAYQNLQRQKEAGVTELFGQRIAGAGGLLESSAMASLGSRGIQNPRMAQILAGTTPEEEASNRRLREYGGLLGEAGAAGAEMAAMEVARAEINVAEAEVNFKNAGGGQLNNQPQGISRGGIVYASKGQLINFVPKGTDTVPAMLTPGEFVVNRGAVNRGDNYSFLRAINNGHYTANAQKLNSNNTSIPNIIKQLTSNPQIAQTQDTHRQVVQNERNISNVNFDVQKLSKQLGKFMSGFDGFMENFSEQVGKLGNTEVSHKLGDVNLNINGGQFLQSMADGLKQQLMEDLGQKLQSIKVNNVGNIKLGRTSVL